MCGDGQHMAADVHTALRHVAMQQLGTWRSGLGLGSELGLGLGLGTCSLTHPLTQLLASLLPYSLPHSLTGLSAEAAEAKLAALAKAGRIQREIWH